VRIISLYDKKSAASFSFDSAAITHDVHRSAVKSNVDNTIFFIF
jgi:hypothetical protein